jgi:hypothetical protein
VCVCVGVCVCVCVCDFVCVCVRACVSLIAIIRNNEALQLQGINRRGQTKIERKTNHLLKI